MDKFGISKQIDEYAIRELTNSRLAKAGLPTPPKPVDSDSLFAEWDTVKSAHGGLSRVPFETLGDFLDRWTGLTIYARWVEAVSDIDQATAREIKEIVKKQLYTLQEGGRELRDALVYVEDIYTEWHRKYTEALTMYIAAKALREGYEMRMNAISREISRRIGDAGDTRRTINRGVGI